MLRSWRAFALPVIALTAFCYLWSPSSVWRLSGDNLHIPPSAESLETANKVTEQMPQGKEATMAAVESLLRPLEDEESPHGQVPKILAHNRKTFESLVECVFVKACPKNQTKIVVLDSPTFLKLFDGTEDEIYWERSAISALESFGVSYLFSLQNASLARNIHSLFPNQVHAIIFKEGDRALDLQKCFDDPDKKCVQTKLNPDGIPAWKIFAWSFTDHKQSPLGSQWSLVREPYPGGLTYIGYSVPCDDFPYVEQSKRKEPARAWIHANLETYLYERHNLWPHRYFESAEEKTGMGFVAALEPGYARLKEYPETKGIISVPRNMVELDRSRMSRAQILQEVAQSRLLVGLLDPKDMAFPYEALCMGVPFLNPISQWVSEHRSNRSQWTDVENTVAKYLDPPYVYNVFRSDESGFEAAIRGALANPIQRYTLEMMRVEAVQERWAAFLERDWHAEAVTGGALHLYS